MAAMVEITQTAASSVLSPASDIGAGISSAAAPVATVTETATPVTETAPAAITEAPKTETPAAEASATVDNILGDAKPEAAKTETPADAVKTEVKPEGDKAAPKEGEAKTETKVEAKVEEKTLPVYDEFKLPENYSADKESLSEFTKLLGEIESSKLDHKGFQDAGQKLIDLGTKAVQDSIQRYTDSLVSYHENQKKEWFEAFKSDPELGGDNIQETVGNLRSAVETYGGDATQIAEFRSVMKETGVGNHPAVIRVLNNMDKAIRKFNTETDNGNGGMNRIVAAARPAPMKVKPHQVFYAGGK